ncbi:MAG: PQQ-binding-like beta-propeller repeat protein [Thermoanaerobaculia bacterium]|nr:PQQ-binding-like beta-propeller repeat protein [Thermoanaerobaculia bacterium]
MGPRVGRILLAALLIATVAAPFAGAGDWTHWRGPLRNGTSPETGLIDSWSVDGENLLWRVDFVGRSTPLVLGDRVCVNGRAGEGIDRQEVAACYDVETGEQLWERRFNVYHTTVPWTRAGWPNPALDPDTGYMYVQGVGGDFFCFDSADGRLVWHRNFMEEFGFMEGYGGRTQTPVVDGDRVIVTFASTGWGETIPPRHRIYSFDKTTGELQWYSTPGTNLKDKNTQSTPALATIDGTRLIIHGNGDGHVYAVKAGTGEPVWDFHLSQRGINTSALVDGKTVYVAHSEENVDTATMGRVVAIDASGEGDVTETHEIWRADLGVGFSTPALAGGKLYLLDNSANVHVLDAATGEHLGEVNIGRVGKASPVVADGKMYVTEVNGRFVILDVSGEAPVVLDTEKIRTGRRWAETYSSPAIADGRIFFTTEEGLYAIGEPNPDAAEVTEAIAPPGNQGGDPASIQVVPAEVIVRPGDTVQFTARVFNEHGEYMRETEPDWSLEGLAGSIAAGEFRPDFSKGPQAGAVWGERGPFSAKARVRVVPDLPFQEDYESLPVGSKPPYQVGYVIPFEVAEIAGNKALVKKPSPIKIHRHITFLGAPDQNDYTVVADLMGTEDEGDMPDVGLINSGYTFELMGEHQQLEFRSWHSARRMYASQPFAWQPDTWYRMRFEVRTDEDKATLRGKVWPRDQPEPETWTFTTEDPHPIRSGSPGLSGYSPTPIYFDNIEVTKNR